MDTHTLSVLEFDKVMEKVSANAVSQPGRDVLSKISPSTDEKKITRQLRRITEVRKVLEATGRFPVEGVREVREHLAKARIPGSVLAPQALLDVDANLRAARTLRDFLLKHGEGYANLSRIARELTVLTGFIRRIAASLGENGDVLDEASEDLADIRTEIRRTEERIRDHLKNVIEDPQAQDWLQEDYYTIREGRHVLPVKANLKSDVPGIVHDRSDTGQTIFIEPTEVVGLGNELRDLHSLERVEITRILAGLTDAVRDVADEIERNQVLLARADADRARARFSLDFECSEPLLTRDGPLSVMQGRHPLLLFSQTEAVPLDITLSPQQRSLVISGPNAGGKTVALKTLGLLTLMAQAGLHVPAGERSTFRLFRSVYADIGDNQSIEESLSSFSSHMVRVAEVLPRVNAETLVLLDELGAATDPEEGGALSCAILDEIHRSGAYAVVTTHLSDLKVFAHNMEGMANASTQFDQETGQPTYRIKAGAPGSSRAIDTVKRLGFPADLVHRALERLSGGKAELERMLSDLDAQLILNRTLTEELEEARAKAETLRETYRAKIKGIKKEKREVLRKAAEEGAEIVREGRRLVEDTIRKLREEARREGAALPEPALRKARTRLEETLEGLRKKEETFEEPKEQDLSPAAIAPGSEVLVKSLGQNGVITAVDHRKKKVTVRAGILEIQADLFDLAPPTPKAPRSTARNWDRFKEFHRNVEPELMLVGLRVEEAESRLREYLNDALLSDREQVRIVHGMGSGALRKMVDEFLRTHPSVASYRRAKKGEGGQGATVVLLKE